MKTTHYFIDQIGRGTKTRLCLEFTNKDEAKIACEDLSRAFMKKYEVVEAVQMCRETNLTEELK